MKYGKLDEVLRGLKEAQEAESDVRQAAREAHLFVNKRDGQWEPYWWTQCEHKPRYTFDMTTPVVKQISNEISRKQFDIKVSPASGDTREEDAKLFGGLLRAIQNSSKAVHTFSRSGRYMTVAGVDGWMIKQEYVDDTSFDQDLTIKPIHNYLDSVWFDVGAKEQDMSDANHCWVLEAIPKADYLRKWPNGSEQSVSVDRDCNAYYDKADQIIIGQLYYKKKEDIVLHLMSDGSVHEETPEFLEAMEALAMLGVKSIQTRKREKSYVYSRLFDNDDWLNKPQKTVFCNWLPVIPSYANFNIIENKVVYYGAVEKLRDPQRVYNYAASREIEEGALAPRAKYWMTKKQAAGHENELATMNTNADPVQFYNSDESVPGPPEQRGGARINEGLINVKESMRTLIGQVAGMFAANMGDNPGLQTGVAIEKLQERGDAGNYDYVEALEIAISHTGRILVDAIPRVYHERQTIQILGENGSSSFVPVNRLVRTANGVISLNDLSRGKYSVTCSAGASFKSQQSETVAAITEVAQFDPTVMDIGGDVFFANIPAPGMMDISKRKRRQLFEAGGIPVEEMTEKERAEYEEKISQPPPPDPNLILAEAEAGKADAQKQKVLAEAQGTGVKLQLQQRKQEMDSSIKARELQLRASELAAKNQQQQFAQSIEVMRTVLQQNQQLVDEVRSQAETLKVLREAMGVDGIIDPSVVATYHRQADEVKDSQNKQSGQSGSLAIP